MAFSSPFDATAVDFLEELDAPLYKIASFENIDIPLIKKVAATGKPVIISTGAATIAQIDEAVRTLRENNCEQFVLLKCTSTYPATPANSHIRTIPHMAQLFNCHVGLSDHTLGIGVPVAAVALGAIAVEKHFTLARADGGVDSAFSLEPSEMKALVEESQRAWEALGRVQYGVQKVEKNSTSFKRSLYIAKDIQAGEAFTSENIRAVRPGDGLAPKYYELLLGKHAPRDLKGGKPLRWEDVLG